MAQDVDQFAGFVDHFGQGLSEPAEALSATALHAYIVYNIQIEHKSRKKIADHSF